MGSFSFPPHLIIAVSAVRRESLKGHPTCLSIVGFSYFYTFQTVILLNEALFSTQGRFLRLELSRGTTTAAVVDEAMVDLKLEVK